MARTRTHRRKAVKSKKSKRSKRSKKAKKAKRKTRKAQKNRRSRKRAGADTPNSSYDEGHTDKESISVDPNEPFHADIEPIALANEVHELEMELLDDSFASEEPDESVGSIGSIGSIGLDDDTLDLDASLSLGGRSG